MQGPRRVPRPRRHNAHTLTCRRFGLIPVRSPLLGESRLLSFPLGTEMVHFPRFASPPYGFRWRYPGFTRMGFPIRRSPDRSLLSDSPGLIAAGRVLRRLPAPRHPLHALSNLTIKFSQDKKNAAKFDCQRSGRNSIGSPPTWGGFSYGMFAGPNVWWSWPGSNRRPPACKTGALPTELQPRREKPLAGRRMVGLSGLEPLTSRLSGGRSNQLSYRPTPCGSRAGPRGISHQRT